MHLTISMWLILYRISLLTLTQMPTFIVNYSNKRKVTIIIKSVTADIDADLYYALHYSLYKRTLRKEQRIRTILLKYPYVVQCKRTTCVRVGKLLLVSWIENYSIEAKLDWWVWLYIKWIKTLQLVVDYIDALK